MSSKHLDKLYMQRCFELAKKAGKNTRSNPSVGCVIVHNNIIIGEGYHQLFGQAHAEVNALQSVTDEMKSKLSEATMYVSLEPCSHHGKTPPCANKIIESGIKNLVIGCLDPNPLVSGNGIKLLKENHVNIQAPFMEEKAWHLISKFRANLNNKPHIILKWAESADFFISKQQEQTWLTQPSTQILTHKWRTEVDGILIGKNTAIIDDPSLTARKYEGSNPIRILIDHHLETPNTAKIYSDGLPTIIFNLKKNGIQANIEFIRIKPEDTLDEITNIIFEKGIFSLLVEGGAQIIQSFIKLDLWHEARIIRTKIELQQGVKSPQIEGKLVAEIPLGKDHLYTIQNSNDDEKR